MRRLYPLAVVVFVSLPALAGEALVGIQTKKEGPATSPSVVQTIEIGSEVTSYGLCYDISIPEGTPPGKCTSRQWIFRTGYIPLGMTSSGGPNWYTQGFLRIRLDELSLHDIPATWRIVRAGGLDAMAEAAWETPKGPVFLRLAMRGGDDKLLMQLALGPETKAERLELSLLAYPQGFEKPWDRRVTTATRELAMPPSAKFDPAAEPWALYFDPGMTGHRRRAGPCGLVYVPEEVASVTAGVGYSITTTLKAAPGGRKITVGLWDFTGVADAPAMREHLRRDGLAIAADLRGVARAEWSAALPAPGLSKTYAAMLDAVSARRNQVTAYDEMTGQIETPHEKWAKPLAGGPVRVLVVAPRWMHRDTVELGQRLDMVCRTVSFEDRDQVTSSDLYLYGSYELYGYPRKTATGVLAGLRRELQSQQDCMILSGFKSSLVPEHLARLIADKVRGGTGLILLGGARGLLSGMEKELRPAQWRPPVPVEQLPVLGKMLAEKKPVWKAYTAGRGRVLVLNYNQGLNSITPAIGIDDPDVLGYFDYFHGLAASAVLWASGRELPVRLRFTGAPGALEIESARDVPEAGIEVLVDHPAREYESRQLGRIRLPKGKSNHQFACRGLASCPRLVSVRISEGEKVLGFGMTQYAPPAGAPHIAAIELERPTIAPGETVRGLVRLSQPCANAALDLTVNDSLGRIVRRLSPPVRALEIPFEIPIGQGVTPLHTLWARLVCDRTLADISSRPFAVVDRAVDDFHFLAWADGQNSALAHNILRALAEHGVDWIDNTGTGGGTEQQVATRLLNAARHGIRSIPYITRISSEQISGRVRQPCLTDPNHLQSWTDGLRERARGAARFDPPGYTLGDENYLVSRAPLDVCISPTCLAAFRRELRQSYRSIAALNASWQSSYGDWEEIVPATLDEVKTAPAQWPRWADHRMFMDRVFTRAHRLGREAIRSVDPAARVGFDGVFNLDSWHGYDFYNLCRACDMVEIYALHFMQIEYLRAWHQPGALVGSWYNELGNRNETWAKRLGWHLLFHGFNSSWYWMAYQTGPALLFPDLRPTPQLLWMEQSIREIKGGIGKLLLHARRLDDGIAVHYSQASVHANTLLGRYIEQAQTGCCRLVEDLGLQYDLLSSEQIEQGRLADFKVLLLPSSFALGEAEVAAIRQFVAGGGMVIADTVPGILDGHCRLLDNGQLDDVFGVARSGLPKKAAEEGIRLRGGGLEGELACLVSDTGLKAAGAEAWAAGKNAPAMLVRQSPPGWAAVLNIDLGCYEGLRKSGNAGKLQAVVRKLVELGGVRPLVRVMAGPADVDACEIVRFADHGIGYVCLIRDQDYAGVKTEEVTVRLPAPAEVYDVRARKALGRVDSFPTRLVPGEPKIFAIMPYAVEGVSVAPPRGPVAPGSTVKFRLGLRVGAGRLAGPHCLRVELFAPGGQPATHYARNVLADRLSVEVPVELALNDPPGKWQVRVTDVASGRSGQAEFQVK